MDTPPAFDRSPFTTRPRARRVAKSWGYEILLTPEDAPYTAKLVHVEAGKCVGRQVHDSKIETQTLIDGQGFLMLEDETGELHEVTLKPRVGYHIAVGQHHRLCAAPDQYVTVYEVSSPEEGTTWRLEDDYHRPGDEQVAVNSKATQVASREAAIEDAEAELDEIIERLERQLKIREPELFDREDRLVEDKLAKKLLERAGGKKTLTYDDIVNGQAERRTSQSGSRAVDAT